MQTNEDDEVAKGRRVAVTTLSVVIPCYRSPPELDEVVAGLVERFGAGLAAGERRREEAGGGGEIALVEIVLIDDASPDEGATWGRVRRLAARHAGVVRGYRLATNVGEHGACLAGLTQTRGDVVVTMDDDGQHAAADAARLALACDGGHSVVYASYRRVQQGALRVAAGRTLHWVAQTLGNEPSVDLTTFRAMGRAALDEALKEPWHARNVDGLLARGRNAYRNVGVQHLPRRHNASGYDIARLMRAGFVTLTAFGVLPAVRPARAAVIAEMTSE